MPAAAIPTTGAATAIASNNFTVAVGGASGDAFVVFGGSSGVYNFASSNYTVSGGVASVTVWGAPLLGGTTYYYVACDSTGCASDEKTVTLPQVTPIPTTTFGVYYDTIASHHFAIDDIAPNILPGYTATGVSSTVVWGIMFVMIFIGFWLRTKSVRLTFIVGILMAVMFITPSTGLYLGVPLSFQVVAQCLIAAALAGIVFAFARN